MKVLYLLGIAWGLFGDIAIQNTAVEDSPVRWSITSAKISEMEYVLFFDAMIDTDWHLYCRSQAVSSDDLATPLITFYPNPNVEFAGFVNEIGEPEPVLSELIGVTINVFKNKVSYNTIAITKSTKEPITVKGEIDYITCTKSMCVNPPKKVFEITLN